MLLQLIFRAIDEDAADVSGTQTATFEKFFGNGCNYGPVGLRRNEVISTGGKISEVLLKGPIRAAKIPE